MEAYIALGKDHKPYIVFGANEGERIRDCVDFDLFKKILEVLMVFPTTKETEESEDLIAKICFQGYYYGDELGSIYFGRDRDNFKPVFELSLDQADKLTVEKIIQKAKKAVNKSKGA